MNTEDRPSPRASRPFDDIKLKKPSFAEDGKLSIRDGLLDLMDGDIDLKKKDPKKIKAEILRDTAPFVEDIVFFVKRIESISKDNNKNEDQKLELTNSIKSILLKKVTNFGVENLRLLFLSKIYQEHESGKALLTAYKIYKKSLLAPSEQTALDLSEMETSSSDYTLATPIATRPADVGQTTLDDTDSIATAPSLGYEYTTQGDMSAIIKNIEALEPHAINDQPTAPRALNGLTTPVSFPVNNQAPEAQTAKENQIVDKDIDLVLSPSMDDTAMANRLANVDRAQLLNLINLLTKNKESQDKKPQDRLLTLQNGARIKAIANTIGYDNLNTLFKNAKEVYHAISIQSGGAELHYPNKPIDDDKRLKLTADLHKMFMICEALEKATKIFERSSTATRQPPTERADSVATNNTAVDLDVGPSVTTSIFEDGRPLTLVADDSLNDDTGITNLGDAFQTVSLDHYRKEAQEALERVKALEKRKPSDSAMDKFKSWFSFKRPATLARWEGLSQFRKKIFTSKLLRVGLRTTLIAMLPAMTPLILSPDNHSANNKEWARNLKVNSVKRDTITQEQNEKNNNEFLSAGKKALELIEKDANRIPSAQSPSIKLRLSNNPKLNIDYTVDMENTTRVQIPEGSNVWRLVVADLEKKVSDFKDMDKPYKDTLVANIIKAMSAVYKSTSSNNPNNNLSMVRVGEYINIPTIKI